MLRMHGALYLNGKTRVTDTKPIQCFNALDTDKLTSGVHMTLCYSITSLWANRPDWTDSGGSCTSVDSSHQALRQRTPLSPGHATGTSKMLATSSARCLCNENS